MPPEHDADLRQLEDEQRRALREHMPDRRAALGAQRSERLPWSVSIQFCLLLAIGGTAYRQRQNLKRLLVALACFGIAYFALFYAFGLGYSISSIVRQEYLYPFLAKDVVAAAAAYGIAAVVLFRLGGRRSGTATSLAVWICSAAAMLVGQIYFQFGLRMDGWMLEIGPAFQAYLHMVAIVGVVLGTLLVGAINRLLPPRQESIP